MHKVGEAIEYKDVNGRTVVGKIAKVCHTIYLLDLPNGRQVRYTESYEEQ